MSQFAEVCREYGVGTMHGDRYGGLFSVEAATRHGVNYTTVEQSKSNFYKDLLPILTSGKAELLEHTRLINQLCGLERRTARSGNDSIDHPPGAHDDLCNAAAIAMVLAHLEVAPALWEMSDLF